MILDRLLSRSQRLVLKGKSMRPSKTGAPATGDAPVRAGNGNGNGDSDSDSDSEPQ